MPFAEPMPRSGAARGSIRGHMPLEHFSHSHNVSLNKSQTATAGDFLSLPIHCSGILSESQIKVGRISISQFSAVIEDEDDRAVLTCEKVPEEFGGEVVGNAIVCQGTWESDASEAKLSVGLSTFVPMPSVQRAQSTFGGEVVHGMCAR